MQHMEEKALLMVQRAHAGQKDKGGQDYRMHPLHVADCFEDPELRCVALLHDVLEDSAVTEEELQNIFPEKVVEAVITLTKKPGERYQDYLQAVKSNPMARLVKIADLNHNMDMSRLPKITHKDETRLEKYKSALEFLRAEDEKSDGKV